MFAAAAGYAFADGAVPAWPLAGSDADTEIATATDGGMYADWGAKKNDNIKIVSKIGPDLMVENNINIGGRSDGSFSGGANMLHGNLDFGQNIAGVEMPLMNMEMPEDDGGGVLSISKSKRTKKLYGDAGFAELNGRDVVIDRNAEMTDMEVETADNGGDSADAEAAREMRDQVRSWVVANGQTLREVLQLWCDKEGWDLIWGTEREYPIQASAVFKGRFVDVSSALVRNFGRATPTPYAKFYNGNRVLVISTAEE
jgi:hypothetical protein